MTWPRALDLFCGVGGASMGLHRAGFDVTGIDIKPQPRYPFTFIRGDALNPPVRLEDFDLVWASPPCQHATPMSNRWRGSGGVADERENLIPATRSLLCGQAVWVIENVQGSSVRRDLRLTGEMFGLKVHRPRLFEASFLILAPSRPRKQVNPVAVYGKADGRRLFDRNDGSQLRAWTLEVGRKAMGMPWGDEDGIREAVPPVYAEHIGHYAMLALGLDGAQPASGRTQPR